MAQKKEEEFQFTGCYYDKRWEIIGNHLSEIRMIQARAHPDRPDKFKYTFKQRMWNGAIITSPINEFYSSRTYKHWLAVNFPKTPLVNIPCALCGKDTFTLKGFKLDMHRLCFRGLGYHVGLSGLKRADDWESFRYITTSHFPHDSTVLYEPQQQQELTIMMIVKMHQMIFDEDNNGKYRQNRIDRGVDFSDWYPAHDEYWIGFEYTDMSPYEKQYWADKDRDYDDEYQRKLKMQQEYEAQGGKKSGIDFEDQKRMQAQATANAQQALYARKLLQSKDKTKPEK